MTDAVTVCEIAAELLTSFVPMPDTSIDASDVTLANAGAVVAASVVTSDVAVGESAPAEVTLVAAGRPMTPEVVTLLATVALTQAVDVTSLVIARLIAAADATFD